MLMPFFVWDDRALRRIHPERVAYLEAVKNYTNIYVAGEKKITKYMVRSTLAGALKKLPGEIFIRTHKSHAVSIFYIDSVTRKNLLIGDTVIPIGRQFYESVVGKLTIIE
jgi:DNA-binding LytR/AlgR family response regulator